MHYTTSQEFIARVEKRNPGQSEYIQAVSEVVDSLWPFCRRYPRYAEHGLLDRMIEPERIVMFRVAWVNDDGDVEVNRGYRVQHSMALGPYKGGLRFHPSVNLSILKFLAFEQTLKNALTTLPLGGGKGGCDFDPKGRSEAEVMRFCQAFALEMHRHLGPETDVPAGDIGVGTREIGYLSGMVQKIRNRADCVFTGKGLPWGGSRMRSEATGYGVVYFAEQMLACAGQALEGLTVGVSGSGNVAQHAIEKAMQLGARVITASDSGGYVVDTDGFTPEKLAELKEIKNKQHGRVEDYAKKVKADFHADGRPWNVSMEVALPCATQNELDEDDARALVDNGVLCVVEGANMPCTPAAMALFEDRRVPYAPGKASNAGGVATSGLEMSQNAMRLSWDRQEVEDRLHGIMRCIHQTCVEHGRRDDDGSVSYVAGANVAGFARVADAMLAQGVV